MPWSCLARPDERLVEIRYVGRISPGELQAAFQETMTTCVAHDLHSILADCSELRDGHSLLDLYGLMDALLATGLAHKIKEAIVMPQPGDSWERVRFWETSCLNRGIRVRIFPDRPAAVEWLTAQ